MPANKTSMKSLMAYELIRDMILTGAKLPGTRLILTDLENELGIGRGPVREALMRLDKSGLVKNIPFKGAIVATPPQKKEVLHIYDLRVELETRLAVEAIPLLTEKDFSILEEFLATMETLPSDHYQYDRNFHDHIYQAAGLPHLDNIHKTLVLSMESVLNIYRREKDYCIKCNAEHRDILNALKSGDPDLVKKTLTININSGIQIIKETYDRIIGT